MTTLKNGELCVLVSEKGAEVNSIQDIQTGKEYMWNADPRYWDRHSPTLFPGIGFCWNNEYRIDGQPYKMGKHGFVRDRLFELVESTPTSVHYCLKSSGFTTRNYPFLFELHITYVLEGRNLATEWEVRNNSERPMYFQIGGHPALNYRNFHEVDAVHGYLSFDNKDTLKTRLIGNKGCMSTDFAPVVLDKDGLLPLTNTTFNIDTIVLQDSQVRTITLHDKKRNPYVIVHCASPVLGIWSPNDGKAPFVCIEPWYGLPDTAGFEGDITERGFINMAPAGKNWGTRYSIDFL
jgi:galactose mutarotase-like enzyme